MSMPFETISLNQTTSFIVDNRGKTVPTSDDGIPLIATNCIDNDDLYPTYKNVRFISQETYNNWFRSHPLPNDLILTLKGSQNGAVCLVPENVDFVIAQDMVALRVNENIMDSHYLLAALRSREVQHQIKTLDVSGVIPHLKKSDFDKLILPYPSEGDRKFIGRTYYLLTKKIDSLRKQNETLEQIAQTLFKRWFVDFEFPDESGNPYKSSGGKMVASDLGEIPEGWRVGTLGNEFTILMGQSPPGDSYNKSSIGQIFYQGRTDFGFRFPTNRLYTTEPKRMANQFDTLVSVRAPVGDINMANEVCCIGRGLGAVKSELKSYCFNKLKSLKNKFDVFEGEGTVFGSLSKSDFNDIDTIIPYTAISEKYDSIAWKIDNKVYNNTKEIESLIQLRDTLLPKLMSGEIRVKME